MLYARHHDLVLLKRRIFSGRQNRFHVGRHRGRRRTLAKSMPSRISVKPLKRISIPAGEAEPSSRTARADFGTSKVLPSNRLYQMTSPSPANQSTFTRSLRRLKKRNRSPDSTY
jgi:hypothetical protein